MNVILSEELLERHKNLVEILTKFKEDPDQCKTNIFYITPDGSKIEALLEEEYTILGLIVESPFKSQIGLMNTFLYRELTKI